MKRAPGIKMCGFSPLDHPGQTLDQPWKDSNSTKTDFSRILQKMLQQRNGFNKV